MVTDNCVYIDGNGNMSRKLNYKDIMAFALLKKNNFNVAIISGEKNSAIQLLSERFNINEVHQGIRIKIDVLKDIISRYNLSQEEYLYIGDDINDKASLEFAKYKVTVPQAISEVKDIDGIQITETMAGNGAFREVVDCLIG